GFRRGKRRLTGPLRVGESQARSQTSDGSHPDGLHGVELEEQCRDCARQRPRRQGLGGNFCNSLSENQKTRLVKHLALPEWPLLHLTEVVPMPQNHTRPNKVLVVDDDVRIRDLLRRYLMQEGFEVMLAEDGKALNRVLQREAV